MNGGTILQNGQSKQQSLVSYSSKKFNEFSSKYEKVPSELQQSKNFNSHLLTRIIRLERNAVTYTLPA